MDQLLKALPQRTVVIGNSGSGKSFFARAVSARFGIRSVDLDQLHWEDDGYGRKRDEEASRRLTARAAAEEAWVIEGVYGWLAEVAVPRATALVWLDLPWSECREGLINRGPRRGADTIAFSQLIEWAQAYWTRTTPSSFAGHSRIFADFGGPKIQLHSRQAVREFTEKMAWSERAVPSQKSLHE
jgi:adenylate kinase family enzyme